MRRIDEGVELAVDVRRADFELPTSSSRDVVGLEEAPGVRVLTPTSAATSREAVRGRPWALSVRLGDVRVHSSTLDVRLKTNAASPLSIALDDRVTTRGEVVVDQGSIVLNKRDFEVDSAVVRLNEDDATNPYLAATAHWDGPANRVFVDYVGTLKPFGGEKLRFRSDPPKSQAEIVQSLLFGDTTGGNLVGNVSATVATMLANDIIASAFGGALRDVLALDLGTTETGGFVGAKVDLSDAWSFGGKLNPFGANAASRTPGGGCGDFFFDYRISRAWSLRGTGGYCDYEDQTSTSSNQDGISLGLDVLWRYRY
jgi:hypothetical protein